MRLVEDTNGDGVADKSSVYRRRTSTVDARRHRLRRARAPRQGLVHEHSRASGCSPAQPDARRRSARNCCRGFGVRFNYTGHDFHGLALGPRRPDLFLDRRSRHAREDEGRHAWSNVPDDGAVFRCEPDGTGLELVHRGLRNPQELAFDELRQPLHRRQRQRPGRPGAARASSSKAATAAGASATSSRRSARAGRGSREKLW